MNGFTKDSARVARAIGRQWAKDRHASGSPWRVFLMEDALRAVGHRDLAQLVCREAQRELRRLQGHRPQPQAPCSPRTSVPS